MPGDKERVYDAYLVASARVGDEDAWRRLLERWQPRFLRHAWRLTGDRELAAEAAQEAWMDVLRGIARLEDAIAFPAWSLRIVTRRCANLVRDRQRGRATRAALAREPDTTAEERDTIELCAELAAVQTALATLPDGQRAVIGLFYLEEMSVAEAAVVLGIPPGTVKTRLMHARRKLKAILTGDEHERHR